MYKQRFGLHRKPFQSVQLDSDYFPSEAFQELEPIVSNTLRSDQGIAVLTGPAGVGKTVTLDAIRRSLQSDTQTVLLRGGTIPSADELLYVLNRHLSKAAPASEVNASTTGVRRWEIVEKLQRGAEFWGPVTLLIDDVHLVQPEVFSELRTLMEEDLDGRKLVRLLVAGPLQLEEVLAQPTMGDFARRIRSHVFLQPLRTTESVAYLRHQFAGAGGTLDEVFTATAIEHIVTASGGLPRCLNLLTDETLMICEETDKDEVTPAIVSDALARLQHLPVVWNAIADEHDDHEDESASIDRESVVEIGAPTAAAHSVAPGVIEIGGPAPAASFDSSDDNHPKAEQTLESDDAAFLEDDTFESVCCEFVADDVDEDVAPAVADEERRDHNIPESISELTETLQDTECCEFENECPAADAEVITEITDAGDECASEDVVHHEDDHDQSLEHHLLLATTADPDDERQAEPVDEEMLEENALVDVALSDNNEALFARILADGEADREADAELFDTFTPWQPAGEWPPAAIEDASDAEALQPDSEFQSETSDCCAETTDEGCAEVTVADSDAGLYATQLADPTPVFDRFTWCELGRSVTSNPTVCHHATEPLAPAEWPPRLDGIAPVQEIAMEFADEAEVLLATIQSAHSMSPVTEVDDTANNEDQGVVPGVPVEPGVPGGETAIRMADDSAAHVPLLHDVVPAPAEPPSFPSQEYALTPDTANSTPDGETVSEVRLHDSADVAAVIASAVQRYISDAAHDQHVADADHDQSADASELETTESEAVEGEETVRYTPRLLQAARTRLVAANSGQRGLRQAAGAESSVLSDVDEETADHTEPRPQLTIAGHVEDSVADEDASPAADESAHSFRNLFTRLRRMRDRRP